MLEKISIGILHSFFALAIIWDIVATKINRLYTLSKVTLSGSINHPSLPFMLGILLGHMLWPMIISNELEYWKISLPILSVILIIFTIIDFSFNLNSLKISQPIIYFLIGLLFGHFGWPQKQ